MAVSNHDINIDAFRSSILSWYDRHKRVLPWRAGKGAKSNPYHVWLSEIMLQQTTVVTVGPYFMKFIEKWPTVQDLANAPTEEIMQAWAGLGYYARARNLHKCAKVISEEFAGVFPSKEQELIKLPGIGPYTAAAVSSIAFNNPATVMDGNIERVMARVFAIKEPLPDSKPRLKECAHYLSKDRRDSPDDYAQALMDLGSSICTPKSPKCMLCPVQSFCRAYQQGIQEDLPARKAKKPKPKKYGYFYWIANGEGAVLLEKRPEKGLLGGMTGLPTSRWSEDIATARPESPLSAYDGFILQNPDENVQIKHVFTHFELSLTLQRGVYSNDPETLDDARFIWVEPYRIDPEHLPTLFRKAVRLMI